MAATYNFPLEDAQDYKARITFTTFRDYLGSVGGLIANEIVQLSGQDETVDPAAISAFRGLQNQPNIAPLADRTVGKSVSLYLPPSLNFADGVTYDNAELGLIGAGVATGLASGATGIGQLLRAAYDGANLSSIQSLFSRGLTSEGAQVAALRISSFVNQEATGAIETTTGIALNPNRRSSFRGVNIRTFNFEFKLIPTSEAEAREVKNIVRFFRTELYPEASEIISEELNLSAAYRFPSKFNIRITYDGKPIAMKFLPCFLQQVQVTYNSTSGMSFHKGGDFQETNIALTFIEERTLSRQDIEKEYGTYPGRTPLNPTFQNAGE